MAEFREVVVSVRVFGDDLDPDWVTGLLGAAPTRAWRKGDRWLVGKTPRERASGAWVCEIDSLQPGSLQAKIEALLARLGDAQAWASIGERFEADVFCGLFMTEGNEGAEISPGTLAKLAERGLTLQLDIYGTANDDD